MSDSAQRNRRPPEVSFEAPVAPTHDETSASVSSAKDENKYAKFWREQARPFIVMVLILFCMRSSLADWNVVPTGSMKPSIIEGDRIFVNKLAYDLKIPFTHIAVAKWSEPKRGEVVVFDSPADGIRLVKRLIGMPGDKIEIRSNVLYINNERAQFAQLPQDTINQVQPGNRDQFDYHLETVAGMSHPVRFKRSDNMKPGELEGLQPARHFGPAVVPAGCYFMLGDNRDESRDSRYDSATRDPASVPNGLLRDQRNLGPGFVPRDRIVGRSSAIVLSLDYDDYYLPRGSRFFR